jgi:DNA-binding beta-propeller fold protein YncE
MSADGSRVFVSGLVTHPASGFDYGTVAYDASNGTQLWGERYTGPGGGTDIVYSMGVSPDGLRVYVTGSSAGTTSDFDYATVAYATASGAQLWVSRYNGPGDSDDIANSVAVSPGGSKVFVTGSSLALGGLQADIATLAYDASTGTRLWLRRYDGPASGSDGARSVAVSPGGSNVYVAGFSEGSDIDDYITVSYSASDGAQRWIARYEGPGHGGDVANGVTVAPGGGRVFVTGVSTGAGGDSDFATIAYSA